jgi:hypothetical protein
MKYEFREGRLYVHRTDDEKARITDRLKKIEGQVRGVRQMVEDSRYCLDEVQQDLDDSLIPVEFLVNHRSIVLEDLAREVDFFQHGNEDLSRSGPGKTWAPAHAILCGPASEPRELTSVKFIMSQQTSGGRI